ncbi:hypothetical protein F2Q69_00030525 [Brassica cretica]|uniref:Uncharacterized protein n=1 Tax=Brassica cretica TaxID=69181 RepID=A0A8S9S187_BRACR|nr:hypothetical protein F2Q69_00030525 [Brassica cretica]
MNANGTWYKKEPNYQYNNYQQKPFYNNNQQGGYQARQNYSQDFPSKGNQSTQGQASSSTSITQESSTDTMLKQILESQTRSEKHIGYELKNLHTKVDGSYNDLHNKLPKERNGEDHFIELPEEVLGSKPVTMESMPERRGPSLHGSPCPWTRTTHTEVTSPMGEDDPHRGHFAHGGGGPTPRSPCSWARTAHTKDTSPVDEDDPHRGHLAHGRGGPAPRSPRPWARTTRAEVTSPMGEDDPHRGHLARGRRQPAPRSPRPWSRTDLLSRNHASSSKFP